MRVERIQQTSSLLTPLEDVFIKVHSLLSTAQHPLTILVMATNENLSMCLYRVGHSPLFIITKCWYDC